MSKLPISAVLVIYNEEEVLERCLTSCADLVDEIIVVHDGECSDKSLEIAAKYTQNIFVRDRVGSAEPHRAFTYQQAKNEWILQLDADEFLSEELRQNLGKLIEQNVDIYALAWPKWYQGKYYFGDYKRALFRKNSVYYIAVTHEYVKPIDRTKVIKKVDYPLMHQPMYENISWSCFRTKWLRLAKVHAQDYQKDFEQIQKWNYQGQDWDQPTKIVLQFPLVVGTIIFPFLVFLKRLFLRKRIHKMDIIEATLVGLYYFYVGRYILQQRKEKRKEKLQSKTSST